MIKSVISRFIRKQYLIFLKMGIKMIDDYYIKVVERRRIFLFYTALFDEKIFEIKPS